MWKILCVAIAGIAGVKRWVRPLRNRRDFMYIYVWKAKYVSVEFMDIDYSGFVLSETDATESRGHTEVTSMHDPVNLNKKN